jgi:16S rRNA (uracil1498-N3)-methyltransferase
MRRFILPSEKFDAEEIPLEGDLLHHFQKVLRLNPGENILLLDGCGLVCRCRVELAGRNRLKAVVLEKWREDDSVFPVHLIQALPKAERMEWLIQKGTELGISEFSPVNTKRSIPVLSGQRKDKRVQRWRRIAEEASRQSERPYVPVVNEPRDLAEVLLACREEYRLVCWEEESRSLGDVLPDLSPSGAAVLVGPEGGFGKEEIELVKKCGFHSVSLGPRILRTETAGFTLATILQYVYGDMGTSGTQGN